MSTLGIILLVILLILLFGGFRGPWGYGYGLGHSGISILGVLLIVVIVLLLMGRL